MRKRFFAVMAAALVVSGMPVMEKETSTEEKISEKSARPPVLNCKRKMNKK